MEKEHILGQSIVSNERVINTIVWKDYTLEQFIVSNKRVETIIIWKDFTLEQTIVSNERVEKTIVWKDFTLGQAIISNQRVEKSIVSLTPGLQDNLLYQMKEYQNLLLKIMKNGKGTCITNTWSFDVMRWIRSGL